MDLPDIFSLVDSLSRSEKRHFQLNFPTYAGERRYLDFFNALDKLSAQYDPHGLAFDSIKFERKYQRSMRTFGMANQISALKSQLMPLLLRSLRNLQEQKNREELIVAKLQDGKVLERKKLFDLAIEKFEEAEAEAEHYQYKGHQIEALNHLIYLYSQKNMRDYVATLIRHCQKMEEVATQLTIEVSCRSLHYQAFALMRVRPNFSHDDFLKKVNELEGHPLLAAPPEEQTFFGKIYLLQTKANLASLKGNIGCSMHCSEAVLLAWDAQPHLKDEYVRYYIICISNYLNSAHQCSDYTHFERHLKSIERLEPVFADDQAEKFQSLALFELLFHMNQAHFDKACDKIPAIERGFLEHKSKINRAREITIRYNMVISCMAVGDCKNALEHSFKLFNLGRTEHRIDIQVATRLLQIILHYELGNLNNLNQIIRNLGQNLRDNDLYFRFEQICIRHFRRIVQSQEITLLMNVQDPDLPNVFEEFKTELANYGQQSNGPVPSGLEEILIWIETKASRKSFGEVLRERLSQPSAQ